MKRTSPHRTQSTSLLSSISLALTLALLLAPSGSTAIAGQPGITPSVTVEPVGTIQKSEPKIYIGTVKAYETVGLLARVSGTLWKANFIEGSMINAGDVLFEIEDTDYASKVQIAEALVRQAEADLELAVKEHDRSRELLVSRAIAEQSFDVTEATELLKEARVSEAKANLRLAEEELRRCRIIAPISGRIGEKLINEGNFVTPSSGILANIVSSTPAKVQFSMSESDYFRYFTNHDEWRGAEVVIIRANGEKYTGGITTDFVDNQVDKRTDTIMVSLSCDNLQAQLLPGGFVQVHLSEDFGSPLPAVPAAAVMTDGKNNYVYIANSDNVIERREIEVGDVVGRYQIVEKGLTPGETVLVGGMNKVRPGAKVNTVVNNANGAANGKVKNNANS